MIKEVEGNLLTYPGLQVIAHQCNCLGIMGAGIAKQIKTRNPELFKAYVKYCKRYPDMDIDSISNEKVYRKRYPDVHNIMGTVQFYPTDDGKQVVANLFGQYSISETTAPFIENGKPRQTDYDALKECLHRLHIWMVLNDKTTCGVPDHLSSGLAGGNWDDVVYPMIKKEFEEDEDITLYIVKYNG